MMPVLRHCIGPALKPIVHMYQQFSLPFKCKCRCPVCQIAEIMFVAVREASTGGGRCLEVEKRITAFVPLRFDAAVLAMHVCSVSSLQA